ncbi:MULTISPECIES: flagellar basal body rod protein FlgC [Enterococcus]|uniref:Flagellar basal-body rod protein FlgC n=1 Tax=Enterococcus alcedinis TaxID=1274384 RepID=A0A917JI90_9ENTE|nr:flagellar basal body rod protein FlgC [Enterococcus alcedinis]MBP2102587.1 flagellar basal-body rod protein FlgC [Enterococcus alcedinis]GGI66146.1 flagellar basal-body rod protein FlgC [Enterococcus alcedinis]
MSIFTGLNINASGLALERLKLDTISTNIANVNTHQTENGEAYRRKTIDFSESLKNVQATQQGLKTEKMSFGVKVNQIREDQTENLSYDPTNPNADEDGYIALSNVNTADEMVAMIEALRTYEANASSLEANKLILRKALEISKD